MNTPLGSVSRFVTSVSCGKRVLTRITVARKHRIKFPWNFELARRICHQAFSSWVISLCSVCICFSLLYTLRIRFPWYFRIPRRLDHQAFSFRVISSCLSFIFLSFLNLQWWCQHLTWLLVFEVRVGRRRNAFCRIVSWVYQWLAVRQLFPISSISSWSSIIWLCGLTRILLSSILLGS